MFGGGAEGRGWGGKWGRRGSLKWKVGGRKTGGCRRRRCRWVSPGAGGVGVDSGRPSRATTDAGDRQLSPFFCFFCGCLTTSFPHPPPPHLLATTHFAAQAGLLATPAASPTTSSAHARARAPRVVLVCHRRIAHVGKGPRRPSPRIEGFGKFRVWSGFPIRATRVPRSPPAASLGIAPAPPIHYVRARWVNTYARRSTGSARGRVPPVCRPIATQPVLSTTPPSLPAPSAPPLPSSSAGRGGAGPRGGEKGGRGACAWAWPTDGATTTRAGAVQAAATVLYSTIHTSCMFCMLSCHATAAATPPPLSPLPSPLPPPSPSPSRPSPRPCRPPRPPFAPPSGPAGSWACRRRLPPPPAPPCPPAPRL